MKIYFTRHGETEWNSRDIISGVTDIHLSEKGREQAAALSRIIAASHRDIDTIITSPMIRARETAAPSAEVLDTEPLTDDRLREWDYGSYEGKPRNAEGFLWYKLEFGVRMPDGGESVFDVVCRVYGLIEELKRNYSGKNVLLVCHGGICRIIETYYRDMTREEFAGFFMGNCELRCFEIKEES